MNEANRELCAAIQDTFRTVSRVLLSVWVLMLFFILLSGSGNLLELGEAILVVPLSMIGWLFFGKLTRDLFYGRRLLRAMAANKHVQSRMLADFGLSVSAAAALLPGRLRTKALLSIMSAVVALAPLLWSPPVRFYVVEDFQKLQKGLPGIASNTAQYHLKEINELLLDPNYAD